MIRVGLVGFGLAGRVFHAPLIASVEGLELAAVVERQTNLAAERNPGIVTHRTLESLLADASLDLVVVATPSGTHFQVASQVLRAGKHAIVDKPAAVHSSEIAELHKLAVSAGRLLIPFHNRRWDGDFRTIRKLLDEGSLGRLVSFQSSFDRWSPGATRKPWKDDPAQGGGILHDLGTHIADQALVLFGKPQAVQAEIRREREGDGSNDSIQLRLHYAGLIVELGANCLSSLARPRFYLRGTQGNYWKWGLDPQEPALTKITRIDDAHWGEEPPAAWGTLAVDADGGNVTRAVTPFAGDYRLYYAAVRDAVLGKAPAPVTALEAWRVARVLELAQESSASRSEVACNWTDEPE